MYRKAQIKTVFRQAFGGKMPLYKHELQVVKCLTKKTYVVLVLHRFMAHRDLTSKCQYIKYSLMTKVPKQ